MKIPETSANVGAYYGNEENGQWQPNGVIIDSGVPGGVVGSGDGLHPQPVYPVHIPRGHVPGYVMAGAYYAGAGYGAAPAPPDDFADYMWMENEEEFDKQVMQQLEEEALMEQCIEAMLEDEQRELERHNPHYPTTSNGNPSLSLEETVSRSTLNPLAAEFVPTFVPRGARTEEKKVVEVKSTEETQREPSEGAEEAPQVTVDVKTEDPLPPVDPPEVSAADVQPIDKKRDSKKDSKTRPETKKPVKADPKKTSKPAVVKSETKVAPKKKEVKAVKSEPRLEEREKEDAPVIVAELPKVAPLPAPAPAPLPSEPAGPKPINYAAAARANKPRAVTAPAPAPAPAPVTAPATNTTANTKKPIVQRKNSAK
ncbi:MICAL-like protein 1 isoform X2 [Cydia strobilella]|uniref:MICAL-like protein 1 isoform X2 n=1 Tax=Cydia strobilella TaxID=1100964 RepID=UPI0030065317